MILSLLFIIVTTVLEFVRKLLLNNVITVQVGDVNLMLNINVLMLIVFCIIIIMCII